MTDEQLQAIEARVEAATPGPWTVQQSWHGYCDCVDGSEHESYGECADWYWSEVGELDGPTYIEVNGGEYSQICQADMEFIAAARDDVPALIAEVIRLQCKLAEVQELIGIDTLNYIDQLENQVSSYYHEFGP